MKGSFFRPLYVMFVCVRVIFVWWSRLFFGLIGMPWSEEARERARRRILESKPWRFGTGPKSRVGKERVSRNALKHGRYAKKWVPEEEKERRRKRRQIREALREFERLAKELKKRG